MSIYAGIDIGSCTTKAVVIDGDCKILGTHVLRSGVDYKSVSEEALSTALGNRERKNLPLIATGYGRHSIDISTGVKTEIACHAKGGFHYVKKAFTLIDIGGQDTKVIVVDDTGHRKDFKMNRKCAAGTGTFIEEIATRMGVSAPDLVRGVFESVVDRVMEMLPLSETILLSGGVVEFNPIVADIFKERVKAEIIIPPHPQLTGALGAALFARELPN
jgi:activator of 2-hydroxyglutaryl-CoA dehydratase